MREESSREAFCFALRERPSRRIHHTFRLLLVVVRLETRWAEHHCPWPSRVHLRLGRVGTSCVLWLTTAVQLVSAYTSNRSVSTYLVNADLVEHVFALDQFSCLLVGFKVTQAD